MSADSCTCETCVNARHRAPGFLLPENLPVLAEFLGLTEEGLLDSGNLIVTRLWADYEVHGIRPRRTSEGGLMGPHGNGYPCVFLTDDDRCAIHDAKPFECAVMDCSHDEEDFDPYEELVAPWEEYWRTK